MARKIIGRVFLWGPFALIMAGLAWKAPGLFWLYMTLGSFATSILIGVVLLRDEDDSV